MKKLLMIGSVRTELLTYVRELPKGNEEAEILATEQKTGGSGFETARAFQLLGFPCDVICDPGEGIYGEAARQAAARAGIGLCEGSGETGGCIYRMIDPRGNEAVFYVEGSEYHFSMSQVYDIDPDEYSAILTGSEMLAGENAGELIDVLRELELPLYVIYGERAQEIQPEAMESLSGLSPVLIMEEKEAYALNGGKDRLDTIAAGIADETQAPVMILSEQGILYQDDRESWVAPCETKPSLTGFAAFVTAALMAGVDRRNSMMFAIEASGQNDPETIRQRLAGMILHR